MTLDPASAVLGIVLGALLGAGGTVLTALLLLVSAAVVRQKRALDALSRENAGLKRDADWPGEGQ